ncbi:MAG: Lipid A biosynthesis palmitoleoyltransferase [Holosporales bacterium]
MKNVISFINTLLLLPFLILLFFILAIMLLMGIEKSSQFFSILFMKIGPKLNRHKVVLRNLELCFPNMDEANRKILAIKSWGNLGALFSEMIFFKFMKEDEFKKRVTIQDDVGAFTKGGKFVVISHLSNFEAFTHTSKKFNICINCLYKMPKNKIFHELLLWIRKQPYFYMHKNSSTDGLKAFINALKKEEIAWMLVDQNAPNGIDTTFFNLPVKTTDLVGKLSLKFSVPIYMARIIRTGTAFYEIETLKLDIQETDTSHSITQKMNDIIEGWIREHPEQYYWVHRRFKLVGY